VWVTHRGNIAEALEYQAAKDAVWQKPGGATEADVEELRVRVVQLLKENKRREEKGKSTYKRFREAEEDFEEQRRTARLLKQRCYQYKKDAAIQLEESLLMAAEDRDVGR
jgi:hypothetical protein